ncbi:hypothetical protein H1C71_005576, partial [Ictidomys tridecemlineatus]
LEFPPLNHTAFCLFPWATSELPCISTAPLSQESYAVEILDSLYLSLSTCSPRPPSALHLITSLHCEWGSTGWRCKCMASHSPLRDIWFIPQLANVNKDSIKS